MQKYIPTIVLTYGALLFLGGLIGYFQTGSKISFVAGFVTSLVCFGGGLAMQKGWKGGLLISLTITALMTLFFGYRFFVTFKLMPGGIFAFLSLAVFLLIWRFSYKS